MKRVILALSFVLCAAAIPSAQDVKSTTTVKADDAKPVMYTGCVAAGTAANSFILENAIPTKTETKTETEINAAGMPQTTKTTTTTYSLVPSSGVDFVTNVGHKVEVTAMLVPAGDDKSKIEAKTETKVEGQPAREVKTEEKVAQASYPQLRVVSVKHLADRCS